MSGDKVRSAWSQVSDELTGLGLKIKLHMEQEFAEDPKDEVSSAIERLGDAIDDALDAAGNVVKDPAVREDVASTGRLIAQALTTTFHESTAAIKKHVP